MGDYKRAKRYKKEQKKKPKIFLILILLIIFFGGIRVISEFSLNVDYKFVPEWEKNKTSVIIADRALKSDYVPLIEDEEIIYPVDFIKQFIDETIFWEESSKKLTVTNSKNVIRMSTNDLTYYVNSEPLNLDIPIYEQNGNVYIPSSIIEKLYSISSSYNQETDIVIMDYNTEDKNIGFVKSKSKLYSLAEDRKVIKKLKKDEQITVYGTEGNYTKVRTIDGIPGYIYTKNIRDITTIKAIESEYVESFETWKPENGKITMVWNQVTRVEANKNENRRIPIENLDVVSPTWFSITDNDGNIRNIADESYVQWAHEQGYKVWALVTNSFDSEITHNVLSDTNKREKVIKQLLAFASLYDLDGINIDFEEVAQSDGIYYVQFIRELTPMLKAQGLTVSVDMYIPKPWTSHYKMSEVSKVVDYIAVMVYDEHWSSCPESGSVSSLPWAEQAMEDVSKMVESSKIIMGIPFYTRVWEEKVVEGRTTVSSSSLGMQGGINELNKNNAQIVFDEESQQNYGEYEKDGALYRIWLEDEQSVQKRMELAKRYDIAGISAWKYGLEKEGTWDIINSYMKY